MYFHLQLQCKCRLVQHRFVVFSSCDLLFIWDKQPMVLTSALELPRRKPSKSDSVLPVSPDTPSPDSVPSPKLPTFVAGNTPPSLISPRMSASPMQALPTATGHVVVPPLSLGALSGGSSSTQAPASRSVADASPSFPSCSSAPSASPDLLLHASGYSAMAAATSTPPQPLGASILTSPRPASPLPQLAPASPRTARRAPPPLDPDPLPPFRSARSPPTPLRQHGNTAQTFPSSQVAPTQPAADYAAAGFFGSPARSNVGDAPAAVTSAAVTLWSTSTGEGTATSGSLSARLLALQLQQLQTPRVPPPDSVRESAVSSGGGTMAPPASARSSGALATPRTLLAQARARTLARELRDLMGHGQLAAVGAPWPSNAPPSEQAPIGTDSHLDVHSPVGSARSAVALVCP